MGQCLTCWPQMQLDLQAGQRQALTLPCGALQSPLALICTTAQAGQRLSMKISPFNCPSSSLTATPDAAAKSPLLGCKQARSRPSVCSDYCLSWQHGCGGPRCQPATSDRGPPCTMLASSAQAVKLHLPDKMMPRVQVMLATRCWVSSWGQPAPAGSISAQPHKTACTISKQAASKPFT